MNERFEDKQKGDRLKASDVNRMQDAIARLSATGFGDDGITTGTFRATKKGTSPRLVLVRMCADNAEQQTSLTENQSAALIPQLFNAVEQYWDEGQGGWADLPGGYITIDPPFGGVLDKDGHVACFEQDGRYVPVVGAGTRLAVTTSITTPVFPRVGSAPTTETWYPDEDSGPTVYGITFVIAPYPPIPGRWLLPAADGTLDPNLGVPVSDISVPGGPHATVMNLDQGENTYLEEGSLISVFQVAGRWFTDGTVHGDSGDHGGGSGHSACDLAGLNVTDCLEATGPSGAVVLRYGSGKWNSTEYLVYPGGSGLLSFWWDATLVKMRLTLTAAVGSSAAAKDLMFCADTGCWVGGALTGHVAATTAECSGVTFPVCLRCVPCDGGVVPGSCCPADGIPARLYMAITGGGPCDGVYTLDYDYALSEWVCFGAAAGTCTERTIVATASCVGGVFAGFFGDDDDYVSSDVASCVPFVFTCVQEASMPTACGCTPGYGMSITSANPSAGTPGCFPCLSGATHTLTAGSPTGCFVGVPTTSTITCSDAGHYAVGGSSPFACGVDGSSVTIVSDGAGVPVIDFGLSTPIVPPAAADAGYSCDPVAWTFHVDNGAGDSCVFVVS